MSDAVRYYDFENFRLDIENKQLLKDGSVIAVNNKALTILLILVRNSGRLTKKEDIINEVWHDHFVEESNLTQHIYTLRKALGATPENDHFIKTYPKIGYLFSAKVTPIFREPNRLNFTFEKPGDEGFQPEVFDNGLFTYTPEISPKTVQPPKEKDSAQWLTDYKLAGILTAVLFFGVLLGVGSLYLKTYSVKESEDKKVDSIAVLPFRSIVESEEDKKLGLGMADAIIVKLSKLQQIPVRPTSAVFLYVSQPNVDPVSAGQNLGVDTVLEGTVQRDSGKIRVTVQLINVKSRKTLWAESFNEDFRGVFAMQDIISEKVANSLTRSLSNNQKTLLEQHPTENPQAYQAYMFGIYFWNTRTRDGLLKAVDYFKDAIEIDPNYAYAYAGLADAYTMLAYYHYDNSGEMYLPAKAAALKAISLDDRVAEAYIALALVQKTFEHDEKSSRESLEKAIEISPYNATAHQRYAWYLVGENNLEKGIAEMRMAHQYSPLSPVINTAMCEILNYNRAFDEAKNYCSKAEELLPDFTLSKIAAVDNLFFDGKKDEAVRKTEEYLRKDRENNGLKSRLAYFYAKTGKKSEAAALYEHLQKIESGDNRRFAYLANIAFALDRKDEARALLRQGAENCAIPFFADFDPFFEDIRFDEENRKIISSECRHNLSRNTDTDAMPKS